MASVTLVLDSRFTIQTFSLKIIINCKYQQTKFFVCPQIVFSQNGFLVIITYLWLQTPIILIMLSLAILASSRHCIKTLTKVGFHFCSAQNRHIDILNSQFHIHGVKHFQKSRQLNRRSTTTIFQIDKLITQLQKQRIRMKELKEAQNIKNDEELITHSQCGKYLDIYHKLKEKVEDLKINEEWGYRIVGWYNIQSTLNTLIEELLDKGNKVEHNSLIEAINWMKPHQLIINAEDSVQELIKQKAKIDNFYKQLAVGHSLQTIRQIQSIFQEVGTNSKSKYYHSYLATNIDSILQNASKNQQNLKNTLWVIEMYVITFNDEPEIIQKIQKFFLNSNLLEKPEVLKTFIRIYNQMGRVNSQIYNSYIRHHIKNAPANIIQVQLLNLEFLIHSEARDEQTLNQILKNIAKISKNQAMSSGHKLHIHYLLHYLKIKDIKFTFPFQMLREYSEICRTFEEDGAFAKSIAIQLDQKSRRQGKEYYNSSCVLKKKDLQSNDKRKKQGVPIQKAEGFKKFKDVKFCCLNIDFCVYDQTNKKGIILEKNYHRFIQSGRLIRMEQIKAQILRHYGLEINYMQMRSELSKKFGN